MTSPDFVVAIPARHAASRLPGKPLRLIGGVPMVVHVARRALDAGALEAWVATDDARIADALAGTSVRVAMTSPDHASGTDRLAGVSYLIGDLGIGLDGPRFTPVGGGELDSIN